MEKNDMTASSNIQAYLTPTKAASKKVNEMAGLQSC